MLAPSVALISIQLASHRCIRGWHNEQSYSTARCPLTATADQTTSPKPWKPKTRRRLSFQCLRNRRWAKCRRRHPSAASSQLAKAPRRRRKASASPTSCATSSSPDHQILLSHNSPHSAAQTIEISEKVFNFISHFSRATGKKTPRKKNNATIKSDKEIF